MKRNVLVIALAFSAIVLLSACNDIQAAPVETPKATTSTPRPTASTSKSSSASSTTATEPYVGMRVSSVPSSWDYQGTDNTTVKDSNGSKVKTTKYSYDTDSRQYIVWVSNSGNKVVKISITERGKRSSTASKSTKSSKSSLDVSAFSDPEDFYYWYYDDFYDYEEAEDYYYAHGGK